MLRQSTSMTRKKAETYAQLVMKFYESGLHIVRDMNPKDKLESFRLRGTTSEILVSPGRTKAGNGFIAVVVQEWKVSEA